MPPQEPIYDVAISFLVQDLSLAQALHDKLSEGLNVFFFPHNQEELAGTDGLESMREPFVHQSRLNVVLYRERWGNTPWTGIEAAAVKDSCLATAFRSLFLFVVAATDVLPQWLPDTHVRFNNSDFTLDQAVGAIKLRVQERGGHFTPMTALKRAQILESENAYRRAKSAMNSSQGLDLILGEVKLIFEEIERQCIEVSAAGLTNIRCEWKYEYGSQHSFCQISNDRVGTIVSWHQRYTGSLDEAGLFVREFNGRLLMNSELGRLILQREPTRLRETKYEPDFSRSGHYGWKKKGDASIFTSSAVLAEQCVIDFLDLAERAANGKIRQPEW